MRLHLNIEADNQLDAEQRARQTVCARQLIRPDDVVRVSALPLTTSEELSYDNLCVWQESEALQLGSPNQRQRWSGGCLPEEELLLIARRELFAPLSLCPRRSRKGPSAIAHPTDPQGEWVCTRSAFNGIVPVMWRTEPDPELTETQWQSLQRVLVACDEIRRHRWMTRTNPTAVRVSTRQHRGECQDCHGTTAENSALVGLEWAGRVLSREYVL